MHQPIYDNPQEADALRLTLRRALSRDLNLPVGHVAVASAMLAAAPQPARRSDDGADAAPSQLSTLRSWRLLVLQTYRRRRVLAR